MKNSLIWQRIPRSPHNHLRNQSFIGDIKILFKYLQFCFNKAVSLGSLFKLFKIIEINFSICRISDRTWMKIFNPLISHHWFIFSMPTHLLEWVAENNCLFLVVTSIYPPLQMVSPHLCGRLLLKILILFPLLPWTELLSPSLDSRLCQWDIIWCDRSQKSEKNLCD